MIIAVPSDCLHVPLRKVRCARQRLAVPTSSARGSQPSRPFWSASQDDHGNFQTSFNMADTTEHEPTVEVSADARIESHCVAVSGARAATLFGVFASPQGAWTRCTELTPLPFSLVSQDVEDDVESDEEVSDDEDGEGESTFPFHDANARVDQSPARAKKHQVLGSSPTRRVSPSPLASPRPRTDPRFPVPFLPQTASPSRAAARRSPARPCRSSA